MKMSRKVSTTKGLILKTEDYMENAKLVTLLTSSHGKLSCIAKGVNKKNSKMRSTIQPFVYGEFQLYKGKNLYTITQGKVLDYFSNIRTDLERMYMGSYILEVLERISIEEENQDMFLLGLSTLYVLDIKKAGKTVLLFFQVKIVENIGINPRLTLCQCGEELGERVGFDIIEGCFLCEKCMLKGNLVYKVSKDNYKILKFLQNTSLKELDRLKLSETQADSLFKLLTDFIEEQLELKLKTKKFLME